MQVLCPLGLLALLANGADGAPTPAPAPALFFARCGIAVTDTEAAKIASHRWLDDFEASIGFWYNWDDHSNIELQSTGMAVPYLPMWWGSQVWHADHPEQEGWCSNEGYSSIPFEAGYPSVVFAWNEPLGGAACKWSMGSCSGGNYGGVDGAKRAAENYSGCVNGATRANRLVSTPCLNNLEPDWFRAFHKNKGPGQSHTVCCSHIYASQYNNAPWDSCDLDKMTNLDELAGQLQGLVDDGTCDYHFIQEIGIGGCPTADHTVSELLIKNLGDAVRDIPSVYLGWFSNSEGAGGTARKTTWLFEENAPTLGKAYKDMCSSLQTRMLGAREEIQDYSLGAEATEMENGYRYSALVVV